MTHWLNAPLFVQVSLTAVLLILELRIWPLPDVALVAMGGLLGVVAAGLVGWLRRGLRQPAYLMASPSFHRGQPDADLKQRLAQQSVLVQLGRQALAQKADIATIFQQVTEAMGHCWGAHCSILELLPDEEVLLLRAGTGWQPHLVGRAKVSTDGQLQAGYTLQCGRSVVVTDLSQEARFSGASLLRQHQIVSGISTVIPGAEGPPFGVLGVYFQEPHRFSQEEINFVEAMANLLADAIARQHSEAQIRRFNDTLEQQVQERTRQLEAANQELQAFSYSVSHDLRAPLRAIEGFARILQEDYGPRLDAVGLDYTSRLINAASHLDQLIQDLLSYSQMGWQDIHLSPLNLTATVESMLSEWSSDIQQTQAQVEVCRPLPDVLAQRQVLWQVLSNLTGNALKFTAPDTAPQIKIWAEEREDQVYLYVQDNGIGIAPEHQERIFQPFERLHGIEAFPGTGIGLAIVQRGIRCLGGEVGLVSQLNEGACFWVSLRRAPPLVSDA